MKKFRFTLSALRTVRLRLEQVALEEYANALQVQKRAEDQLQGVIAELQMNWNRRQDRLESGDMAETLAQIQAYCQFLEIRRRQCEAVLKSAKDRAFQKWQNFLAARRQREVVDKCYQNQRRRYDREGVREEQKMLDEIGLRDKSQNQPNSSNDTNPAWN